MLGLSLPSALEASVCVNNGHEVYFLGGRENSGDTASILKADQSQPADISEIKKTGTLNKKRCLHKGQTIGTKVFIIGGTDFDKIEVQDRQSMVHTEDNTATSRLRQKLESVTYNNFYLKKCSSA